MKKRHATRLRAGDPAFETKITTYDLSPDWTPEGALALRRAWWRTVSGKVQQLPPPPNSPDPERPLRVGYVSGDFYFHSACAVFANIVTGHSRAFVPYAYSVMPESAYDPGTRAIKSATNWRETYTWSDHDTAAQIRADGIDILVDLSGFTPNNRLPVFAMRPAPIQLHGWGYAIPSGLPFIDGLFTDQICWPAEERTADYEAPLDLPCILQFTERAMYPPILDRPPDDQIVFGCFNRPQKVDDRALRLWARVLDEVPGSVMLFKFRGFDERERQRHIESIMGERCIFVEHTSLAEHLAYYGTVDVALDPLTQTGGVTTMETAWMGAPTVTLYGKQISQRVTSSIMSCIGLPQFVCRTEDEYVACASAAVRDRPQLAALRRGIRARMRASPLMNGYNDAVEGVYRRLWREWCAEKKTGSRFPLGSR